MKINSIIDLVKDLDTSRQTKNLNKLLIRILLHLQVEFSIDKEKLTAGKYNVAIVFTSSLEGDHFNGAIGSTLLIDEVELIYRSED